mmetsp:Transcript_15603/g.13336  ORF Transcript_15603/g.13336 Transcript_15603/m.13336 type:complete len:147 (+) Transcript_15603:109-549(+)|eukprot:CAMPEP_0114585172 /NCGR_PEP_ID=MMETSP0125-20121206/8816_1 /TAXON_ID=485358 ORGANISM="Aristerostoma sp., Strain ATCC 50986" /NCGR_SAMPLE_ID=MMETSP0125 /ASSEMBLY_ACC=CAM_ASM_000245 /LENGTH=146 /DNA_ID=CAMNT_0001780185 /DNA_START=76 /DNA_END=516 /DNA_ORIENTATION=+
MTDKPAEKKLRTAKKFTYRGYGLEELVGMKNEQLIELFTTKQRRRFNRGMKHKFQRLVQKLRKAKKGLQPGEKPPVVKTHMRDAVFLPEMVGNVVGIYTGKEFATVEVKFDMIGQYFGEFGLTYRPISHGRPGVGATKGSAHTSLK